MHSTSPGLGERSSGGEGQPLQVFLLENSMDRADLEGYGCMDSQFKLVLMLNTEKKCKDEGQNKRQSERQKEADPS